MLCSCRCRFHIGQDNETEAIVVSTLLKHAQTQLANSEFSGFGIEFEFPSAFVGGVVMP